MAEPTNEQREAIRAYVHGTLAPLIEQVLVKQLSMAAVFLHEEATKRAAAGVNPSFDASNKPVTNTGGTTE